MYMIAVACTSYMHIVFSMFETTYMCIDCLHYYACVSYMHHSAKTAV